MQGSACSSRGLKPAIPLKNPVLMFTTMMFPYGFQKPEFTDKKVMAGKEYEYRVTAENAGGESDPSDVSDLIKAKPLKGCRWSLCLCFRNELQKK